MKLIKIIIVLMLFNSSCEIRDHNYFFNKALEYEEKGFPKKAIRQLNTVLEIDSEYRPALLNRGALKSDLGLYKEAIFDYQKLISIDNDNVMTLSNIGNNYDKLKNYNLAIKYYTLADSVMAFTLSENPFIISFGLDEDNYYLMPRHEIIHARALSYFNIGDFENAIIDFQYSLESEYYVVESLLWTAKSHLELKNKDLACKFAKNSAQSG